MPRFIQGSRRGLFIPACALTIVIGSLAVDARQGQAPQPAPGTPPRPVTPVSASSVTAAPARYVGEYVSITAPVEAQVGKLAFTVDPDKNKTTGKDILVLMKHISAPVDTNTYVTVIGELIVLDSAELEKKSKEHGVALTPDLLERFKGKPTVLANSVVNAAGVDAARRLPPPLTAEEEAFMKTMKEIGSANGVLRKAIEGSDQKMAAESTATLKRTMMQTEVFFRGKRRQDAQAWASDARKLAESIERSAAAGRWDEVKSQAGNLGKSCQTCHTAYRERFDDGSYRIKWPAGSQVR
jgi:cytochrome c556